MLTRRKRRLGMAGGGGGGGFLAATADGSTDYLSRTSAFSPAASDGKLGIFAIALKGLPDATFSILVNRGSNRVQMVRQANNTFSISARNAAATEILRMNSNSTYTGGGLLRIMSSWDLTTATQFGHLYINDVDDKAAGATLTDDNISYAGGNWGVFGTEAGASLTDGVFRAVYFNTAESLDLSVGANRAKLFDANGNPQWDSNASSVTGTAPLWALDKEFSTFQQNITGGGDFTENGTLTGTAWP